MVIFQYSMDPYKSVPEGRSAGQSKLPRVEFSRPKTAIAKDTVSSMQAGIIYGYAGLVDGIVTRMKSEIGHDTTVIATGGLLHVVAQETKTINVIDEMLTLEGLKIIYQRNHMSDMHH